ncbi:hypothetical protein SAMN04487950_2988 [Halogranum rubrum]|uniref:Uncharacterized protein n=1 Tax=Halogranum rubrum TaxID=553466 RepID=A0A1I4G4D6_9EURY|nr:UPF0146 family protein [Halogranum rubrum]SFL23946.1 hypothetical protein SAMN04487950_2988 [Halogranum rubrum]
MKSAPRDALVTRLERYDTLVEVGVGRNPSVAAALAAAGKSVTATDIYEFDVPEGVRFVRDDVVARSEQSAPGRLYSVDALYALNLPGELHRPVRDVARATGAAFVFTTLGYEAPTIPVRREQVGDETLYTAVDRRD